MSLSDEIEYEDHEQRERSKRVERGRRNMLGQTLCDHAKRCYGCKTETAQPLRLRRYQEHFYCDGCCVEIDEIAELDARREMRMSRAEVFAIVFDRADRWDWCDDDDE